jgi:hypothetical protein
VRSGTDRTTGIDVVLDAPGTPRELLAFYQQGLTSQGFRASTPGPISPFGGFQLTHSADGTFCQRSTGSAAFVRVDVKDSGLQSIAIHTDMPAAGPCALDVPSPAMVRTRPGQDLMPLLYAPECVPVLRVGPDPSGRVDRYTSEATVETRRSAAELEGYFARQLQAAGWSRVDGQTNGPQAWSVWQVPGDEGWRGWLSVLEWPGQDLRALSLRLESVIPAAAATRPILPGSEVLAGC